MNDWLKMLDYNPLKPLLNSGNNAVIYYTKKEFTSSNSTSSELIRNLPEPERILSKIKGSGYWKSNTGYRLKAPAVNYDLFETFKQLACLIEMYDYDKTDERIAKAAEYIFSCQTDDGDIRGIIGDQYAPYYTGLIMSHLIKAGYGNDERIVKGFNWLIKMRQNDGGWVIGSPGCFGDYTSQERKIMTTHHVGAKQDFDRSKPFAHSGTGMVLRAFAVHDKYRKSEVACRAADLLKSHFFKKDNYNSYKAVDNWVNFKYPFFWTDLISALDSISRIYEYDENDVNINKALGWIIENQQESGLWKNSYSKIHKSVSNSKTFEVQLWITLSICRILRRFFEID